ncbi:hypothetical protein J6TS2_26500 [Heyndrickxia sporothermodurans]|nr:hypothetical protein J6TS2_26500 [Heyndrickxia sporothermodurans]
MKRVLILCILLFFVRKEVTIAYSAQTNAENKLIKNEIYHDVTARFISPYVNEAINSYYEMKASLTQALNTSPSMIRIINIERIGELDHFEFMVTVEATGFVGKIVPVVDARITFKVKGPLSGSGENHIFFVGFQQVKTYKLPPQWKHIIKRPLE